jgi:hypothetical protein
MTRMAFLLMVWAGCAGPRPTVDPVSAGHRSVPAKCTACHLAPQEHSLPAERWEKYLKNHKRRLRLTDDEKRYLYDFLVGGAMPLAVGGGDS